MASSDITLVIKGDSTKLLAALNKAGAAVDKFSGNAERAAKSGRGSFMRLADAATIAAGNLAAGAISRGIDMITNSVGDAVRRIDTLNNFPKVMGNVGISADKARAAIKKATDGIMGLPTSLDTAAQSIQRLTMRTKDVDKATDLFLALNNAILAGGAAPHIQAAAMEQLSQAFARGKPDLMEWRTAMTAAPAQMDQLAKAMGKVDALALYEDIKDGKISMDQLGDALVRLNTKGTGGLPTFAEQAKNATGGIATGMENAKTAVVRGVAKIIEAMGAGDMSSGFGTMGLTIEKLLNKIAILVKFVKENQTAFTILAGVLGGVIVAAKAYDVAVGLASKATKAWALATKAWAAVTRGAAIAQKLFNLALKASPIMKIVALVGLLVAGIVWLWNNVEGFRNFFIGAWQRIKQAVLAIQPAINAVAGVFSVIATAVGSAFGAVMSAVVSAAKVVVSVVGSIVKVVSSIGAAIWKTISPVVDIFSKVFGFVWRIVSSTVILIVAIVARLAEAIFMTVVGIGKFFVDNFDTIASFVGGMFKSIHDTIVGIFNSVASFVGGVVNTVVGFFGGMISSVVSLFGGMVSSIVDFFGGLIGAIVEHVSRFAGIVIQGWQFIIDSTIATVSPIVGWIDSSIIQPVAGFFSGLWSGIVSGVSWFVNAAMSVLNPITNWINGNVIQPVARFFRGLWDGVVNGIRAAAGAISSTMSTIAGAIKAPINAVIGAINRVIDGINSIKVPDWVPGLGGKSPNFPKIPRLATGGIVSPQGGGSIIYAGDGGQNEWVVPESKMASLVDQINRRRGGDGGMTKHITVNNTYNVRDKVDAQMVASDLGYLLSQA